MIGSVMLIVLAVVLGGWAMLTLPLPSAEADPALVQLQLIRSSILGLGAVTALAGALVIDGMRHYSRKLSDRIDYAAKYLLDHAAATPTSGAANGAAMGRQLAVMASGRLHDPRADGDYGHDATNGSRAASPRDPGAPLPPRRTPAPPAYHVYGEDTGSGTRRELEVQARSREDAIRLGERQGLNVHSVEPIA